MSSGAAGRPSPAPTRPTAFAATTARRSSDLSDVTTYGDSVPTTTDYGTESFGPTHVTATNPTGLAQVFVTYNSVTKPLTTTVPVV